MKRPPFWTLDVLRFRSFRCDCGNSAFKTNKCKLEPTKNPFNEANKYNQNFNGVYCTCHRPYPDPEDPIPDEMIQCILCEVRSKPPNNPFPCKKICTEDLF